MKKRAVRLASVIVDAFPVVVTPVMVPILSSKPSILPKERILGIEIYLLDVIIHLFREAVTFPEEREEIEHKTVRNP